MKGLNADGGAFERLETVPFGPVIETFKEPARKFIPKVLRAAEKWFAEDGRIAPGYFVYTPDDEWQHIHIKMGNEQEKAASFAAMQEVRKLCHAAIFITETWMVQAKDGGKLDLSVRPSQHPDRVEAVQVTLWEGKRTVIANAMIQRKPNKLGPWMRFYDSSRENGKDARKVTGRAVDGSACAIEEN